MKLTRLELGLNYRVDLRREGQCLGVLADAAQRNERECQQAEPLVPTGCSSYHQLILNFLVLLMSDNGPNDSRRGVSASEAREPDVARDSSN